MIRPPQSRSHKYRLFYPYQSVIVRDSTVVLLFAVNTSTCCYSCPTHTISLVLCNSTRFSQGIYCPSIAGRPVQKLLRGELLGGVEGSLSISLRNGRLADIHQAGQHTVRWAISFTVTSPYCRYKMIFILISTMAPKIRGLPYTGFPLSK